MSDTKRIEVTIDDMKFYVKGNDKEDYIRELAADLDKKIKETARSNFKLNQVQTLVLCALNLLDDFEKMKSDRNDLANLDDDKKEIIEKMEEIKDLKKQLSIFEEENKKANTNFRELQQKTLDVEDRNRKVNRDLLEKNKEITDLKEEIKKLEGNISTLEEKNNNASRRIIDLTRELESLYEEKQIWTPSTCWWYGCPKGCCIGRC